MYCWLLCNLIEDEWLGAAFYITIAAVYRVRMKRMVVILQGMFYITVDVVYITVALGEGGSQAIFQHSLFH
jgi:hypothetical protein